MAIRLIAIGAARREKNEMTKDMVKGLASEGTSSGPQVVSCSDQ